MSSTAAPIVCCHGWRGVICFADWLSHYLLGAHFHRRLCDVHEKTIQDEHIVRVYWAA